MITDDNSYVLDYRPIFSRIQTLLNKKDLDFVFNYQEKLEFLEVIIKMIYLN